MAGLVRGESRIAPSAFHLARCTTDCSKTETVEHWIKAENGSAERCASTYAIHSACLWLLLATARESVDSHPTNQTRAREARSSESRDLDLQPFSFGSRCLLCSRSELIDLLL